MSGNPPAPPISKPDRRVLQTREALGDALVQLLQHMPFEDITVQLVLDRAGVGRSTFYAHFADKNDLLLSDVEDFFMACSTSLTRRNASPQRLAPIAEFFAHVSDVRRLLDAFVSAGKASDIRALGQGIFARSIAERLTLAEVPLDPTSLQAHAHALAGSMFSLLDWWLDHGMQPAPAQMDAIFHTLAWSGVRTDPPR